MKRGATFSLLTSNIPNRTHLMTVNKLIAILAILLVAFLWNRHVWQSYKQGITPLRRAVLAIGLITFILLLALLSIFLS